METRDPPPDPESRPARSRAIDWSKAKARGASAWAVGARGTHASVDVGFRLAERDKRVAAGVLAGGIAYRFFFWFLSVALMVTGALGLGDSARVESALRDVGVGSSLIETVDDVSQQSQVIDWSLLVVGLWLVLWTGYMAAKALVLVHAAVWGVPPPPLANALKASLLFTGAALGFIASMTAVLVGRLMIAGATLSASLDEQHSRGERT